MQFTLTYRGPLKSNRGVRDKHTLRLHFHRQLQSLWAQAPLSERKDFLNPENQVMGCIRNVGAQQFATLVTQSNRTLVRLAITLLRPGEPGHLFHAGGDIDNRLKTLLDALRMPANEQEMQTSDDSLPTTIYCLLEDDKLIESISVSTDRLLEPVENTSEAVVLIHVTTRSMNSAMLWQAVSG